MIKAALLLTLLTAVALCAPTLLRNGEFQTFHLKDNTYTELEVYVRGGHQGVFFQSSPYGCDTALELFASTKPNPTEQDHEWRSERSGVSQPTFMFLEAHEHANATLYVSVRTQGAGDYCVGHIVAHIRHLQTLLQLSEGIPAYGVFTPKRHQEEVLNNFVQFKLKRGSDIKFEDISIVTTNLEGRRGREDVILENFASLDSSRPLPQKHQWAGLTTSRGDSFLSINSKDPKFKADGAYYVATHLAAPQDLHGQERVYYSITAHTLTKTSNATLDTPVLLLANQAQSGFAYGGQYAYYSLYVDKARAGKDIRVVARNEFGSVKTFASAKSPRPTEKDHEWAGKEVRQNEVELTINVAKQSFVFIGVWADPNVELLSSFELFYHRGE